MKKKLKIDGISMYACVQKPNKMSDKFEITLIVDDKDCETLKELGLDTAKDQDRNEKSFPEFPGHVFKFKKKAELGGPKVVDSTGAPVDCLIGNGSKVRVYITVADWVFNGKKGVSGYLNAVQIIDLVEFGEDKLDVIEGGFVGESKKDKDTDVVDEDELDDLFG